MRRQQYWLQRNCYLRYIDVGGFEIWLLGYTNQNWGFTPKTFLYLVLGVMEIHHIKWGKVWIFMKRRGQIWGAFSRHPFPKRLPDVGSCSNFSLSMTRESTKAPKTFCPILLSAHYNGGNRSFISFLLFFFRPPLSKDVHWLKAKTRFSRYNKHWITKVGFKRGSWKENATRYSANGLTAERAKEAASFYWITSNFCPEGYLQFKIPG